MLVMVLPFACDAIALRLPGICSTFLSAVRPELKVREGAIAFFTSCGLLQKWPTTADDENGRCTYNSRRGQNELGFEADLLIVPDVSSLSLSPKAYPRTPTSSKSHPPPKIGAHQPQTWTSLVGRAVRLFPTIGSHNCLTEPHVADVALVAVTSHR